LGAVHLDRGSCPGLVRYNYPSRIAEDFAPPPLLLWFGHPARKTPMIAVPV
jgi:hypothetical protein